MTVKEIDNVIPSTRGEAAGRRVRRSVVKPARWKRYEAAVIGTIAVAIFMVFWAAITNPLPFGLSDAPLMTKLFLPSPTDTADAFVKLFSDPRNNIWADLGTSGFEFAVGFVSASIIGIAMGMAMGWYTRVQYALDPFVNFLYATPRVVLIPLFIIWFGIDWQSKVAVIFLGALFPQIINTMAGVRNTEAALLRVARSFGASERLIFQRVVLPGAVPFILTGLRLGVGHALTGVVVAELVAARHGVGKLIQDYGVTFQTPKEFAAIIFIAGTGVFVTWALQRVENRFQSWRPQIRT